MTTQVTMPGPRVSAKRARKSVAAAVILQSIPLLGAGGCTAMAVSDQQAWGLSFLLWLSVLFWGLGYAYAGLRKWFVPVLLIGPLFALVSCTASVGGAHFDYEHTNRNTLTDVQNANAASLQEALIIAASVVLLAVHVWRAVAIRNAEAELGGESPQEPADTPQQVGEEARQTSETILYRVKKRNRDVK